MRGTMVRGFGLGGAVFSARAKGGLKGAFSYKRGPL